MQLIVAAYFDMLRSEVLGDPYHKTDRREALTQRLNNRSNSSIESKQQNVNGVLAELRLPYFFAAQLPFGWSF